MIRLRVSALWFRNVPGDSAAQVIAIGERLAADQERILSPGHPDTLAARKRVLGPNHPDAGRRGRIDAREQVRTGGTDRAPGVQAFARC